eukprot:scaffold11877_cov15-Tisochrysis_lutea.AAC.1
MFEQTSREEIRRQLEHGEALMSRFKHWEPLIRKFSSLLLAAGQFNPSNSAVQLGAQLSLGLVLLQHVRESMPVMPVLHVRNTVPSLSFGLSFCASYGMRDDSSWMSDR